jgi:hypothetical protein
VRPCRHQKSDELDRPICPLGLSTLLLDGPRCADDPRQIILPVGLVAGDRSVP